MLRDMPFWLTLVETFCFLEVWFLFSSKKYCTYTPKETNGETKTKRYTFSPVSEFDVEEPKVVAFFCVQRFLNNNFRKFFFFDFREHNF